MIKVENIEVFNFEGAIRGMRNPLNSWDKSDSHICYGGDRFDDCTGKHPFCPRKDDKAFENDVFCVGKADLDLMHRLYVAGAEHRKFLRQLFVSMDIIAPIYWIAELDTYKVGTTRNSCSFMHRGLSKPFEIGDFSIHDDRVYKVLSPVKKREHILSYKYETEDFRYYIGNNGRKYRVYRNGRVIAERFEYTDSKNRHVVRKEEERIPGRKPDGYFQLYIGGTNGEEWMLHRLVATLFLDNPNGYNTVNHIDGDKGNNCVENLEWCSLEDNIRKGHDNGLFENNKSLHAKYYNWKKAHRLVDPITRSKIVDDRIRNKMSCKELAIKYGITNKQANGIIGTRLSENQDLFMLCYIWENIIESLNELRKTYMETKDDSVFQQIRCLLPSGYNQRFTITFTYENLFNILEQRQNHRLSEWRELCEILKDLPYVREIGGIEDEIKSDS